VPKLSKRYFQGDTTCATVKEIGTHRENRTDRFIFILHCKVSC